MNGNFFQKQVKGIKIVAENSKELFKDVFPYMLIGAGIGEIIYEGIPENFLTNFADLDNFLAISLAAVVEIPMYIRTETMILVANILMAKGVVSGVAIALI